MSGKHVVYNNFFKHYLQDINFIVHYLFGHHQMNLQNLINIDIMSIVKNKLKSHDKFLYYEVFMFVYPEGKLSYSFVSILHGVI